MPITENTYKRLKMDWLTIREYDNWRLVLRDYQNVLGRVSLFSKNVHGTIADVPDDQLIEMRDIARDVEQKLKYAFNYDKMNYQVLGLVDPEFALHILPRYSGPRTFAGREFLDAGWCTPDYLQNKAVFLLKN